MIPTETNFTTPGERYNNIGQAGSYTSENVGVTERWASMLIGGGLLLYGLRQGWRGILPSLAGTALVYRGATGHCSLYGILGIDTSEHNRPGVSVRHGQGVKIESFIVSGVIPKTFHAL